MTITAEGVYEGGVVKLEHPVALKDKTRVHVILEPEVEPAIQDDDPTGWKAAERFIGMWKDAPVRSSTSRSEDHDRVIYKRK